MYVIADETVCPNCVINRGRVPNANFSASLKRSKRMQEF